MVRSATRPRLRRSARSCSTPAGSWSFPGPICCCRRCARPGVTLTGHRSSGPTTGRWRPRTWRPRRPSRDSWWHEYLLSYVAACGVGRGPLRAARHRDGPGGHGAGLDARRHRGHGRPAGRGRARPADGRGLELGRQRGGASCAAWASATCRTARPGPPAGGHRWASSSTPPWSAWPNPTRPSSASRSMPWACPRAVRSCTSGTACGTTWPAPSRRACSRCTWTRTGSARRPTATRTSAAWPS